MDAGSGAVALPGDRLRGRSAVSAGRQSSSIRRLLAARLRRDPREESAGTHRIVGSRQSGDLPIVLVRIDDEHDMEIVKQLLRAHEYWRLKRLAVDLVILNERPPSYASDLQSALDTAIRTYQTPGREEDGAGRGSVYLLRADLMLASSRDLLQTAARAVFVARHGRLSDQLARLREPEPVPAPASAEYRGGVADRRGACAAVPGVLQRPGRIRRNGARIRHLAGRGSVDAGALDQCDRQSPIRLSNLRGRSGSTWSMNARENQLTPWSNDPVSDARRKPFTSAMKKAATFGA